MMIKHKSRFALYKQLLVLPLLALLIFACSNKLGVTDDEMQYYMQYTSTLKADMAKGQGPIIKKTEVEKLHQIYENMSSEQKAMVKEILDLPPPPPKND